MKDLLNHLRKENHSLSTRRDFLAHGLIKFSAALAIPKFMTSGLIHPMLDSGCGGPATGTTLSPFIAFDMAGGASLAGNFLVGKEGGPTDLLTSYDRLGWDPKEAGALNTDFGLPMSAKYSKILQGILTTASAGARQNLRMGSICHFAQDDSSGNKLNAASLALKAGYRGTYITNGTGLTDSLSGGNSSPVASSNIYKPTRISSVTDLLKSTNFGGTAFKDHSPAQIKAMAQGALDLSQVQKADYTQTQDGKDLGDLSQCAYGKSLDFLKGAEGLDPRQDRDAQGVYQINQNTAPENDAAVAASVVMNAIKGTSGPGVWTLGGCDYHTGSQNPGDAKDLEMGVEIGRAVELAFRLKRPLFFQLLTDGGNDAMPGTRNWRGDSGDKCMTIMGYYNPKGAPKMIRQQVGYYTDGQSAERTTLVGSEPTLVGYAVLANYLNIHGKLGEFQDYAPGIFTGAHQLESVLVFDGAVS